MKIKLILFALAAIVIASCTSKTETRSFIPGNYVNQTYWDYGVVNDTLSIELLESNNYLIRRTTGYNRVRNARLGKRQNESEKWIALYDEGTKSLTEVKKGRLITLYPVTRKLVIADREYRKINQKLFQWNI